MPRKADIIKVNIKDKAARKLLKNDDIAQTKARGQAAARAMRAGSKRGARYDVGTSNGKARTRTRVYANTRAAKTDVAEDPSVMVKGLLKGGRNP